MNDKSFIAKMDNAGHSITGLEGRHGAGYELPTLPVLDDSVIVAVLHVLQCNMVREGGREGGKEGGKEGGRRKRQRQTETETETREAERQREDFGFRSKQYYLTIRCLGYSG